MRRNIFTTLLLGGALGLFVGSCSDSQNPLEQPPEDGPVGIEALFAESTPFNGTLACMGNDVLSYNALVKPNEKSSWSKTPVPGGNYCTANDIYLASATVYEVWDADAGDAGDFVPVSGPITCVEGESFQVKVNALLGQNAASARTDIGVWIGQPAEAGAPMPTQAVDGTCNHYNLVLAEGTGVLDLDSDQCGDMASAAGELLDLDLGTLTLTCTPNEANQVEVPSCIGWTVPGGDRLCPFDGDGDINFRMGTVPVNTSKCNCEPFQLDITVLKRAYLEVRKELDPPSNEGLFDLYIDMGRGEQISAVNQGHSGTTTQQEVGAGTSLEPGATHTFAETAGEGTAGEGFDLADYETSWECRNRGGDAGSRGSGTGPGPEDIFLMPDDDVVCTFTNARKPELKLVKLFVGDDEAGLVEFDIGGNADDNDTDGYTNLGETQWYRFPIGTNVAFSEAGFDGTDLADYESSWECDNDASGDGTSGSTGELAAGDAVTCTFTNVRKPELRLVKVFNPANDGGKVSFTIDEALYDNDGEGYSHTQGTVWIKFDVGATVDFSEAGFSDTSLDDYASQLNCNTEFEVTDSDGRAGSVTLAAGEWITCTFTNTGYATVSGYKWHDLNANGVWDDGEPPMNGWNIVAREDGTTIFTEAATGSGESWPDGYYEFHLPAGDYTFEEECPSGLYQSFPTPTNGCGSGVHSLTLAAGQIVTDNNFGNYRYATKSGMKFEDLNANGEKDAGEPGLGGWTITLNGTDGMDNPVFETTTTDINGNYSFSVPPGINYTVCESSQEDWYQSYPAEGIGCWVVTLESGQEDTGNDFGNYRYATKSGYKWNDLNGNGIWDEGEPGLENWTIQLIEGDLGIGSAITDTNGYYEFTGLMPGAYLVCEVMQPGWTQTFPTSSGYDCGDGTYGYEFTLISGEEESDNNFGNWMPPQENDETAWAANGDLPLELRYLTQGNWATYVAYSGVAKTTTLFAGQTMEVGQVTFSAPVDDEVTITITLSGGWVFYDDMGKDNLMVQDYEYAPTGINPSPGLFEWKKFESGTSGSITVPANSFYGVHAVVVGPPM